MTDLNAEHEWMAQEQAKSLSRVEDPSLDVEAYRRLYSALEQAESPEPPFGFAQEMERLAKPRARPSRIGSWIAVTTFTALFAATSSPWLEPLANRWSEIQAPTAAPAMLAAALLVVLSAAPSGHRNGMATQKG